jgi:site-specific recombinase XerD
MLNNYVERFLLARLSAGAAERTVHWYRRNLRLYLDWLTMHPSMVWDDAESVERFLVAQRTLRLKPNTLHARYRSLRAWFTWLQKREVIAQSPMGKVSAPRLDHLPVPYVRLHEYERLQHSIEGESWLDQRDRLILYLLFWCGLRVSECVALRLADIDLAMKLVTVQRGKGNKGRMIPCGDDLGALLLNYVMARPYTPEGHLFYGSDGAGEIRHTFTVAGVAQMLERRCQQAHMRHLSPHKFRHGYAMALLNAGMELSALSQTMGHSSEGVTAGIYAKWLTESLSRQYEDARARLLGHTR